MKHLVVFAGFIVLCASEAIPKDNSQYVEGKSRYVWLSNDEGEPVLVDLHTPVDTNSINARSGANNQYWLFTRDNAFYPQLLVNGNVESVKNSNYKADRPTTFLVHGWTGSLFSNMNAVVRDALLDVYDHNVIVVDWNERASEDYVVSVLVVPSIGESLGDFLEWLVDVTEGDWDKIHLTGYSLGAHVIGTAGRRVNGRAIRATGLDPAGPLWYLNPNSLNKNAARYVEVIHTDSGLQGILPPIADADFYPNGGRSQPGCDSSGCNHARAYQFFAASILEDRFVGRRCSSLLQALLQRCSGETFNMGNVDLNKRGTGVFGLSTGDSWPY